MTLKLTDRFEDHGVILGDKVVKIYLKHLIDIYPTTASFLELALDHINAGDIASAVTPLYAFQLTLEEV